MKKEFQVLLIYDITDQKRRYFFSKKLNSYGYRVQRSAFEMTMTGEKLHALLKEIPKFINATTDNVRVYELRGNYLMHQYGISITPVNEEVMIV